MDASIARINPRYISWICILFFLRGSGSRFDAVAKMARNSFFGNSGRGRKMAFSFSVCDCFNQPAKRKDFFEVLLNAFFLYGLKSHLVLGTAQNLDTAVETFEDTVSLVESIPELKELLKKVNRGTGKREMLLETGDRYKVIAATRKREDCPVI